MRSSGPSHFKQWDDFALQGHGFSFSRALAKLISLAVQNPNAMACEEQRRGLANHNLDWYTANGCFECTASGNAHLFRQGPSGTAGIRAD